MMKMVFHIGKGQERQIQIMIENIKTEAGKEMFKYFNDNYGSSIWGPVLRGILAIEKELG